MDESEKLQYRALCLEMAVKVAGMTGDNMAVVGYAENYWQWMNGSHDAAKTPPRNEDDTPF